MSDRTDASPEPTASGKHLLLNGAVAALLLWLAQPPVAWWPLAWLSMGVWANLAAAPGRWNRKAYAAVALAGAIYWGLALYWVVYPHPLTRYGLPLLAIYLALYALASIALTRAALRMWGAPVWLGLPIAWTGMELLQARLFSGFLMGAVSHSQADQPWIRSIAGYVGAYGVTFAVVLVGATAATLWQSRRERSSRGAIGRVVGAVVLVALAGWGARSSLEPPPSTDQPAQVALIQGDVRATWDPDPTRNSRIMDQHVALTLRAVELAKASGKSLDLIVWPESMFRPPLATFNGSVTPAADATPQALATVANTDDWLRSLTAKSDGAWLLLGVDRFDQRREPDPDRRTPAASAKPPHYDFYNSVALIDPAGRVKSVYDKTHLVPFGEYIPLAKGMPALYYLTPMSTGLSSGPGPVAMRFPLAGDRTLRVCPTICYETVIPHVVRGHVATLTARGERPDALVNVTNDAWFWGASELPMHLACGQYRAIENGLPLLVAANGGLTAVIDATGQVLQVTEPMTEAVLLADVPSATRGPTPYTRFGDWFAGMCLCCCGAVSIAAARRRYKSRVQRRRRG